MTHTWSKQCYKRCFRIVRKVLNDDWDPIGGCPEDEYDHYATKLCAMLMERKATAEETAQYLFWVESEYMGLGQSDQRQVACKRVVDKLIAMKPKPEAANHA